MHFGLQGKVNTAIKIWNFACANVARTMAIAIAIKILLTAYTGLYSWPSNHITATGVIRNNSTQVYIWAPTTTKIYIYAIHNHRKQQHSDWSTCCVYSSSIYQEKLATCCKYKKKWTTQQKRTFHWISIESSYKKQLFTWQIEPAHSAHVIH